MSTDLPAATAPEPVRRARRDRRPLPWRRIVLENLAVVVVFAAAGVGAGFLWFQLWDPPMGAVQQQQWLYLDFPEIGQVFSGTGLFATIGVLLCLVLGVVAALACRASEVVTLVAVAIGSVLASYLAYRVGLERGPVNPHLLALVVPDDTQLPGPLQVSGRTPFAVWPLGALVGVGATFFVTAGVSAGVAEARQVELTGPVPTRRG